MKADKHFIEPMKAVAGALPADDGSWATELKWDGMRLQFHSRTHVGSGPTLFSAAGRTVTGSFPELAPLKDELGLDAVIDGEAVVLDDGRPSFAHLQERIHVTDPHPELVARVPVFFMAFDLLSLDGRSLATVPYDDRRRLLHEIVPDGPAWRVPTASHGDPADLFGLARERGLEGVVCKRRTSRYRAGNRSPDWVKVKVRARQEFVVVGWLPIKTLPPNLTSTPNPEHDLGALILAVRNADGQLEFCGAVGSGLSGDHRRVLAAELRPGLPPFDPLPETLTDTRKPTPQWVAPTTVVEVEFSLWPEGGVLWHPVFRGVRIDRDPADVQREQAPSPGNDGPGHH